MFYKSVAANNFLGFGKIFVEFLFYEHNSAGKKSLQTIQEFTNTLDGRIMSMSIFLDFLGFYNMLAQR